MMFKVGSCNQCGGCCKWRFMQLQKDNKDDIKFYKYHKGVKIREYDSSTVVVAIPFKCAFMKKKKGKYICNIHKKIKQPEQCRGWPYGGGQPYYQAVNKFRKCGYEFIEIDVELPQPMG